MKISDDGLLFIDEKNGVAIIGLTAKAQEDFGNVTFVHLPTVGQELEIGDSFAEVEAEKAVNELVSPVKGTITKVYAKAEETPSLLDDPRIGAAWLMEVTLS